MLKGFLTESYYITLIALELHCGRNNCICKAGYRHECTGARMTGDFIEHAESGQHSGNNDKGTWYKARHRLFVSAERLIEH